MPHEILQQPEVVTLIAQRIASAVAQHVRPDAAETRPLAGFPDEVIDGLARHRLPTLGDEQPRQLVVALREIALNSAELVALDRLFGIERVFERLTQMRACFRLS